LFKVSFWVNGNLKKKRRVRNIEKEGLKIKIDLENGELTVAIVR
jgi:hypothetical protein